MKNKTQAKMPTYESTIAPLVAGFVSARKQGLVKVDPAQDPTLPFDSAFPGLTESERSIVTRINKMVESLAE